MSEAIPANILRALQDKIPDKRKVAAYEIDRIVREYNTAGDRDRIRSVIFILVHDFAYSLQLNSRCGGLVALAAASVALGKDIGSYIDDIVPAVLALFSDQDPRARFFACEAMYNISKVAKGYLLRYFNELFDALSKLTADTDAAVKGGAEMLNNILKDIVAAQSAESLPEATAAATGANGNLSTRSTPAPTKAGSVVTTSRPPPVTLLFSVPRFIPLLAERSRARNPYTRHFLVQWLAVLATVPDVDLVGYLPEFFDGLIHFLGDQGTEVRVATSEVLDGFLQDIRVVAEREAAAFAGNAEESKMATNEKAKTSEDVGGTWQPGAGVKVDYARIVSILKTHVNSSVEDIQVMSLSWITEFISFCPVVVISQAPDLVEAVLRCLDHKSELVRKAAAQANSSLFQLARSVADDRDAGSAMDNTFITSRALDTDEFPSNDSESVLSNPSGFSKFADSLKSVLGTSPPPTRSGGSAFSPRGSPPGHGRKELQVYSGVVSSIGMQLSSTNSLDDVPDEANDSGSKKTDVEAINSLDQAEVPDPLPYQPIVEVLTKLLEDSSEQARVASLEWLLMLHRKAPHRILKSKGDGSDIDAEEDEGTFAVLLRILSDAVSEEVIRRDLMLLAQISSTAVDEAYFLRFMASLMDLFRRDRKLLDSRGSLIVRQLCISLTSDRIYCALAESIEGTTSEDQLEFASVMVQHLSTILVTAPELLDLRKRLRALDSRENQLLFVQLYRSWSHNAVATLTLCLLGEMYDHAAMLLGTFAELEIAVPFLVQLDKLVQLLESPVFTYLRLQLLEPDRYPQLFKCLYGILMLLPQSSAFGTLRNRLNSVSSLGLVMHQQSYSGHSSGSHLGKRSDTEKSKGARGILTDAKLQELLGHFKAIQAAHERSHRRRMTLEAGNLANGLYNGGTGIMMSGHRATSSTAGGIVGGGSSMTSAQIARRRGRSSISSAVDATSRSRSRSGAPASGKGESRSVAQAIRSSLIPGGGNSGAGRTSRRTIGGIGVSNPRK